MFCNTIRRRPQLASLVPYLTASSSPEILESRLITHDIALPAPSAGNGNAAKQLILVSTSFDITSENSVTTCERVKRFVGLVTVPPPLILMVLHSNTPSTNGADNLPDPLADLQTLLYEHDIRSCPILPITSFEHVVPFVRTYLSNLTPYPPATPASNVTALSLLPSMTMGAALNEHDINVLTDICGSIRDIATLVQTREGRDVMRMYLDSAVVEAIREFWWGKSSGLARVEQIDAGNRDCK